jgi:hypothetical protein
MRLGPWGGGLDWEIEVPPHARLQVDVGFSGMVSLEDMHRHPLNSRIVVSLGRGGAFEPVHRHVVARERKAAPGWQPLEVDLSAHAGESLTLRIELEVDAPLRTADLSWLGSPRLALPPEGDVAGAARPSGG